MEGINFNKGVVKQWQENIKEKPVTVGGFTAIMVKAGSMK